MHIFYICTQYVTAQAISGTGALRLAGMFLVSHSTPLELQQTLTQQNLLLLPCLAPQQKFYPYSKTIYLTNPSWPNHAPVFRQVTNTLHAYDLLIDSKIALQTSHLNWPVHVIIMGMVLLIIGTQVWR